MRKELETDKFKNLGCDFWWKKARREREFLYSKEPQMTKALRDIPDGWSQERMDQAQTLSEKLAANENAPALRTKERDRIQSLRKRVQECLKELDEAGATGLDLSSGDPVAREAAAIIRLLLEDGLRVD